VTRISFLRRHLLPGPENTEGYGNYEAYANLSETRERYQQILKSKPGSLDSILFLGTTGELGTPTWWTFLEDGRKAPTDAVTYVEELMRGETSIKSARSQGGVVVIIPAHVLAGRTYKPCALDAFETDTGFRPDHSAKPYAVTCPVKPELKGHPELISRSYRYSDWEDRAGMATTVRMTSKDPELEYLAGLRCLLREEAPFDPVKQVIRAWLEGIASRCRAWSPRPWGGTIWIPVSCWCICMTN